MSLLPQPIGSGLALVLRTWPSGETSTVASLLTEPHGPVRVVAKGARLARSRLQPLVQPGRLVEIEFTLTPGRSLQYLRAGEVRLDPLAGAPTLERAAYLQAALEIVDRCRLGGAGEVGLFDLCARYVTVLSCADAGLEVALYCAFEVALLQLLGIGPHLEGCVHCGRGRVEAAGEALWVDVGAGGLVCGACRTEGHGGAARLLSDAMLAVWPELSAAPDRWPQVAPARDVTREWGIVLHRFLEYHLPGYRLPAALDLLRAGGPRISGADEGERDRT